MGNEELEAAASMPIQNAISILVILCGGSSVSRRR
jgi:hypothetical protein